MAGYNASLADDFYINLHLNTEMELPDQRDTVLHYFERMKKAYPELRNFYSRDNGDLMFEGDKEKGTYRWLAIEAHRLCSGHVNPETHDAAYRQHELVLELAPHLLSISHLDCEALDLMFGYDFTFEGDHDEAVAEALGLGPSLEGLLEVPNAKLVKYEPTITLELDPDTHMQCRVSIETRSNPVPGPRGGYSEDLLSVYFTVRQFWGHGGDESFLDSFRRQRDIGEEILESRVVPRIIRPLAQVIASK